jgi:type VI secretion system secreted protein VgrG
MATYIQADRPLSVTTPLGKDALLLIGFQGAESLSRLFSYQLDMLAQNDTTIAFDRLLGQPITVRLAMPDDEERFFNGICKRVGQGERDETFTRYRMEIVPQLWRLAKKAQSRIFQHLSVPDILKKVLDGLDVAWEIQGSFQPRDYCTQYRETDFNFASRLMEEEGIYYFFKHADGSHKMVVANSPASHVALPVASRLIYEELAGGGRDESRIVSWQKTQELRSGKYTLWDHCFELQNRNLESQSAVTDSVAAGRVTHKLNVGGNDKLEIYDFPGEYAQRFDGVDPGGGDRSADLQHIFEDGRRTTAIRMEEETLPSVTIEGRSTCRNLMSGHRFTLERHFNADGQYVLTSVQHAATLGLDYRSGGADRFEYRNSFTCVPFAAPNRPARTTPKPFVQGSQTATVVGPGGEEIFTDKYGRVKVQFHWDREGQHDQNSSCWVRVAQNWAGKRWGIIFIPRIGQEVIVDFLEGDPDQPIITGRVYNADQMPPYQLPKEKTKSTIKSNSTKGGNGFNELRFEDLKGKEQVFFHAERDMDERVKHDSREWVGNERHLIVKANQQEHVEGDKHGHVNGNHVEKIDGDMSLTVGGKSNEKIGTIWAAESGQEIHLKAGMKIIIEAGVQISLIGPGGFVDIGPAGVTIQGTMVLINSGGAPGVGSGSSPETPKDPDVADDGTKTGKLNG